MYEYRDYNSSDRQYTSILKPKKVGFGPNTVSKTFRNEDR
jgi:hypothetical protein